MTPKILGIPALGFAGYAFAMVVSIFLTVRISLEQKKKEKIKNNYSCSFIQFDFYNSYDPQKVWNLTKRLNFFDIIEKLMHKFV